MSENWSESNVVNRATSCAGENVAPPSVERAIQIGRCLAVGEERNVTCTVPSGPTARSGRLVKRPSGPAITAGGENVRPWSVERTTWIVDSFSFAHGPRGAEPAQST